MLRLFFFLLLSTAALAAELKLRVTDPHSAAVPGARVTLYRGSAVAAVQSTSPEGIATFPGLAPGDYRAEALAPGFAPASLALTVPAAETLTLKLAVAAQPQTVVVTAAGTPLAQSDSGSSVAALDAAQLTLMQPVAASDALRFVPGAVVNASGRRGAQSSLFVRGGESRYNKVILDGVPINEPGGTFDFGVLPLDQVDRLELFRGPQSVLYGSDAMTSVVQMWTPPGATRTPELTFGADGGNFSSARGFVALAGAWRFLDYRLFGDQTNFDADGPNDSYSNSAAGANVGLTFSPRAHLRLRARHSNTRAGVEGAWEFNGAPLLPPETTEYARHNNLIASADLVLQSPSRWTHTFRGFYYCHHRFNEDDFAEPGRAFVFDSPYQAFLGLHRGGFHYRGDYAWSAAARATFGYEFESEHGDAGELLSGSFSSGLRRSHSLFGEAILLWKRLSLIPGLRYVHNESFGGRVVPRVALTFLAFRGGERFSGTRLRFVYSEGIKAPRFEESFGQGGGFPVLPNLALKPEEARSFETGIEQSLFARRFAARATYFHNIFRNKIDFFLDPCFCQGQYVNVNRELAHGAELDLSGRITPGLSFTAGYTYLSSQILEAPFAFFFPPGEPLLRRPRHSGSAQFTYSGRRWGGNVGVSAVGRRRDSDFFGFGIDHAAGYARVDLGAWYALTARVTAYGNVENAFDKRYNEVVGYPALGASFRAGLRFRIGGE